MPADSTRDSFQLSFVVAGFSKCGTTTLCAMLAQHPQIAFSREKEPMFFIMDDYERHWDVYCALFPEPNEKQLFGEGTTFYSTYQLEQKARDALLRHFPDIKLIFVARDPIDRIESGYREFHHSAPRFGFDAPFGLANALQALPALIEDSKYWTRINCYREKIPDERILVVFLEDLKRNPEKELQRCFAHLGIEMYTGNQTLSQLNSAEEKYYDSKLLRRLRNTPPIGRLIAKIPVDTQNKWFPSLQLRRRFRAPIQWDAASRHFVEENLEPDIHRFLSFYGKPKDYWKRFTAELIEARR